MWSNVNRTMESIEKKMETEKASLEDQQMTQNGSLNQPTLCDLWRKEKARLTITEGCCTNHVNPSDLSPVVIYVVTGRGSSLFGTHNGAIHITLFDRQNKELSEKICIANPGSPQFKPGEIYSFTVPKSLLKNPDSPPVEVWGMEVYDNYKPSHFFQWDLDKVVVENEDSASVSVFPFGGWIKGQTTYLLDSDHTKLPEEDENKEELDKKRKIYQYHEISGKTSLPAQVAKLPREENFDLIEKVKIFYRAGLDTIDGKLKGACKVKWESLDDLLTVYDEKIFLQPLGVERSRDDGHFGYQRINGLNHCLIKLCQEIPSSLPVTEEMMKNLLDGLTLEEALEQKRLFVVDLEILQGIPVQPGLKLCAPIGLFFSNNEGELLPAAIRLERDPNAPVFLPEKNSMKWQLVKLWFNNADAIYHQSVAHLGLTHLLMEGIDVATNRQLSSRHPVYKLLKPHFLYLMAINDEASKTLLSPGGYIDATLTTGVTGTLELIGRVLKTWRLDDNGTLPENLKRRGLDDPDVLPNFHYREDALALYHAIRKYVTEYVNLYYDQSEKLARDQEIQAWAAELVRERDNAEGGCGLQGVPGNGEIQTVDQLVTILTSVIFTCSVEHAAVNFAQYEEYAYPLNYPSILHGTPPGNENREYGENDILSALPTPKETLETMEITDILSRKDTKSLGHFERLYFTENKPLACLAAFQGTLQEIKKGIEEKNKKRRRPYFHLDPEFIPNAISI